MKISVTFSYTVDVEVDDRVTDKDIDWALNKASEHQDGRQPFSHEMAQDGAYRVAESVARETVQTLGYRLAGKYPGLRGREYVFAERIQPARMGWRQQTELKVSVGDLYEVREKV